MLTDLEEIRARCEAATSPPWTYYAGTYGLSDVPTAYISHPDAKKYIAFVFVDPEENADFICHAREDIPILIAKVEKLRKALTEMWGDLGPLYELFKSLLEEAFEQQSSLRKDFSEVSSTQCAKGMARTERGDVGFWQVACGLGKYISSLKVEQIV